MTKRTAKQTKMLIDQMLSGLKLKRLENGWYIVDEVEKNTLSPYGPYATKAEAEDDRRGLARTYAEMWEEKRGE